jgi:LL-diaminopimelate aminotransferase
MPVATRVPASQFVASIPPYIFSVLDARRAAATAAGRTLVDLGIGSPDQPVPAPVVEAIREAAGRPMLSAYPPFGIHPEYAEAAAGFLRRRFGVAVDPGTQLLALAGSKEGIAEALIAHVNPGDVVLVPAVHYPVYARATLLAGGVPSFVPFLDDGRLDVDAIPTADLARAKVLIANYPCNPTTATIDRAEWERLLAFADRHGLLLISDLAYSELAYDGYVVPSVLEVPGADELAIEFHSCSKSFNMAGLRSAFVTGHAPAIATIGRYRSNVGYGAPTLSQLAGAAAFREHRTLVPPIVDEYRGRRDTLVSALRAGGWDVTPPRATMYLWLPIPDGFDDWSWVDALIDGPGIVVTPGHAFGEAGKGRFRISLVQPAHVLADAARGLAAQRR